MSSCPSKSDMTVAVLLICCMILILVLAVAVVLVARYICKMSTAFREIMFREFRGRL